MPRQKRNWFAANLANHRPRRWRAERRLDLDLVNVLEELVEPRAPEDAD
jgi:hypothetical protein